MVIPTNGIPPSRQVWKSSKTAPGDAKKKTIAGLL